MKYTPYSYSKISVHQQCPRKFRYTYIDKIPVPRIPRDYFDKGKFIHMLFEYEGDIKKVKETKEFKQIVKNNLLTKEDFKNAYGEYKAFINGKGKSILSRENIFHELPIGMTSDLKKTSYDDPDALIRGYIDAAYLDRKTDTLILVDWKTGKVPKKVSFLQLLFYAIALFDIIPYDKILMVYAYTKAGEIHTKMLKREDLPKYQKALHQIVDVIESDEVFPKHQDALCDYCDFREHCDKDT